MQKVWKSLTKRTPPSPDEVNESEKWKSDFAGALLMVAVQMAMNPLSEHQRKTPKEKKEELLFIAKKARELARLIGRNPYLERKSVYDLFSSDALSDIARMIKEGYTGANYSGFASYDDAIKFALPRHPTIEQILLSLAEQATKEASQPDIVKRKTKNYEALYFVRKMTSLMKQFYGQPLRGVVAAVGSLFFDEIDEDFVRKNAPTRN